MGMGRAPPSLYGTRWLQRLPSLSAPIPISHSHSAVARSTFMLMTEPQTATDAAAPHLASPETNPSFLKGVFLGELNEDLVFPFPTLSAEERESLGLILDSLRAFAAERVDSAKFDHDGAFPDGVRQGLHELGVMG